jgi:hypothetical protein
LIAKRCSSWWYASKGKRHKETCSSSKQTSGVRLRMRDRNTSTRRDNVEGQTVGAEIWRVEIAKRMRFL